jgi:hypothetical protein
MKKSRLKNSTKQKIKSKKTVTETGWAIWVNLVDGDDKNLSLITPISETPQAAWKDIQLMCLDSDGLTIEWAIEHGYRCLRTTSKGEL